MGWAKRKILPIFHFIGGCVRGTVLPDAAGIRYDLPRKSAAPASFSGISPKIDQKTHSSLTYAPEDDTIHQNCIAQIEARFSTVGFGKGRQPPDTKGDTAEVPDESLRVRRWVGREDLPDCHISFCEALSMITGDGFCLSSDYP